MTVDVLPTAEHEPLRILAVSNLWQGANDYAVVRAFRRAGHSVRVVNEKETVPVWNNRALRLARKVFTPQLAKEFNNTLLREAEWLKPDLLFVFKGALVQADTLRKFREMGTICIQFYPDTGLRAHSSYIWDAVTEYDWFFSTKPAHVEELKASHDYDRVSFLAHGVDPETHWPTRYASRDVADYTCDVSFIGNASRKKAATVTALLERGSDLDLKVWGKRNWAKQGDAINRIYGGSPLYGKEYAKAIGLSKINLGLLFEGNADGASPDVLTARTFEIPGAGGFMLHERTPDVEQFFEDGKDCVFFDDHDDMMNKIRYYLTHDDERRTIAQAGHQRCVDSGYLADDRAQTVIDKFHELKGL